MHQPTISIITVTYNAGQFIEVTLNSVSHQTFTNYEHIIIDGKSSDDTLDIIQRCNNRRLRVYSEPDNGLYDAMNKAIKLAKGKYIIFLNAGDQFFSIEVLDKIFLKLKGEDFIYGDTLVLCSDGTTRPYHKTKPNQKNMSYKRFIDGMVICHQSIIVKKEKVAEFDNKNYKIAADIDWAIKTSRKCQTFLDTEIYISKFLEGGISSTKRGTAIKERFLISCNHYGIFKTIIQQIKIFYFYFKRSIINKTNHI